MLRRETTQKEHGECSATIDHQVFVKEQVLNSTKKKESSSLALSAIEGKKESSLKRRCCPRSSVLLESKKMRVEGSKRQTEAEVLQAWLAKLKVDSQRGDDGCSLYIDLWIDMSQLS